MGHAAHTVMTQSYDFAERDKELFDKSVATFTTPRKRTRRTYHSN